MTAAGYVTRSAHFSADGTGIHWPALDWYLSLKGLLKDYLKQQLQQEPELRIA